MTEEQKPVGDEPKAKKKRKGGRKRTKAVNTESLTEKQRDLVQALTTTNNVSEAGRIAGYDNAPNAHRALKRIQSRMPDLLDAHGLTEDYVIEECLKPSLRAMETQHYTNKGVVIETREVIAHGIRQQAEDRYWKLRGRYREVEDGGTGVRSNPHTIRVVVVDPGEAAILAKLLSVGSSTGVVLDVDAAVDQNVG